MQDCCIWLLRLCTAQLQRWDTVHTDFSRKGGIWNCTVRQPCPAPPHRLGGKLSSYSQSYFRHGIACHLKNKIKGLIISWQNVKACQFPFPSLHKVKFFGRILKSPDGSPDIKKWFGQLDWGTGWDPEEYVTTFQAAFLSVLDNLRQPLLRTGERQQAAFGVLPEPFLVPVCLLDFPSRLLEGPDQPDQRPGCPGHGRTVSLPSHWLHSLAFSFATFPLPPETGCMVGTHKASILPDLKHCSWQPLPSPINSEFNTTIWG